jgi:hypothetical protein
MFEFLGALMNFMVRLLAAILCLLFVLTIVIVAVFVTADSMLLSPTVYQNALARERIYERLPSLAAEQIYLSMHPAGSEETWAGGGNPLQYAGPEAQDCALAALGEQAYRDILGGIRPPTQAEINAMGECGIGEAASHGGEAPEFFRNLSIDQWSSVLRALLPPEWLKTQTESVLTQLFHIINTPGAPLSIYVSMAEFKHNLAGPAGVDAIIEIIKTLPQCEPGVTPNLTDASQMLTCRPPDDVLEQSKPQIEQSLADVAADISDPLDILKNLRESGTLNPDLSRWPVGPRQLLQIGRWVVRLSPILCIGILVIVALLVIRSWKGLLRWWGFPIIMAGIAILLTAIAIWIGLDLVISLARENLPATISPGMYDTGAGILVFIAHRYALVIGVEGIVLGAIGLGLVAVYFFIRRGKTAMPAGPRVSPPPSPPPAQPPYSPPPIPPDSTPRKSGIFGLRLLEKPFRA